MTIDKQPEALRLAVLLGKEIVRTVKLDVMHQDAINELRRLHKVNTELLEALHQIIDLPEDSRIHYKVARKALAKTIGEEHE